MAEEEAFGSHLQIDATNRLAVLEKEKVPDFVSFGRKLRAQLQKSVVETGYPQRPPIDSVEDLFSKANEKTTERWAEWTSGTLNEKYHDWRVSIPDSEENEHLRELLGNPTAMEEKLRIRQFSVLEPLRKINPEAWKSLLIASSERQLASLVLVRHWLGEMSDEDVEKLGMSKTELRLFTDIAGVLGKFVDQAYIKQVEMADQPGGSLATPLGEKRGANYVYDIPSQEDESKLDIKTYNQIFPFEWPLIIKRLEMLAQKTKRMAKEGELDRSYQSLAFALERMGVVYGLEKADLAKVDDAWNRLLKTSQGVLEKCPMGIIPQGVSSVTGEAEKIDVESRLVLHTPQNRELEKKGKEFQVIAQEIVNEHLDALGKSEFKVSTPYITYQPFAFGPNLFWATQGESGQGTNLTHENVVGEVARATQLPVLGRIFPREELNESDYQQVAVVETILHELGHEVISTDARAVKKRIGIGNEADIIEELKGEAVGMYLLDRALDQGMDGTDAKSQLIAKIGTIADYVIDKPKEASNKGEIYYYPGVAVLHRLLNTEGILREVEGGYEIIDARAGIAALGELGRELINLYADNKTNPEKIKTYVNGLKVMEDDSRVRKFMAVIRGIKT